MDTNELGKKVKALFSKGAEASKEAFEKAGDKVQNFTDKSVIKIEIKQLESKLEAKFAEYGKIYFENSKPTEETVKLLRNEITELQKEIQSKQEALAN